MTSSDRFPVPVRSAVKSNLTDWCFQNLSKRALNALTVQASTTELGKLFQIFTMRAEKKCFRKSTSLTSLEIVSPGNQHRPMDGVSMGEKTCLTQRRRKWSRRLLSAAARRKSGQIYAMRPRNFRDRRVCCYPGDASDDSGGSSCSSSSLSCQVFYSHTLVEELCRKLANCHSLLTSVGLDVAS